MMNIHFTKQSFQEKRDNIEVLNHIQIYTRMKIQKEQSHGLKFIVDDKKSVSKIRGSGKTHVTKYKGQ